MLGLCGHGDEQQEGEKSVFAVTTLDETYIRVGPKTGRTTGSLVRQWLGLGGGRPITSSEGGDSE